MKKALLLVLLVPFFALSQSTVAQWNVTAWPYPLTPTTVASGITASSITGTGIGFPTQGNDNGIPTSGWPSTGAYSDSKYVQFTLSSAMGFSVSSVNFDYRGVAKKHRIQYSTDNFATVLSNYTYDVTNGQAGEWTYFSNNQSFSTPLTVAPGKTLTVRIYAAQGDGTSRYIKNITVAGSVVTTPLNGTYVIGTTAQSTYTQFKSITSAVNYLNAYGVSGPVTFLLNDANYTSSTETFPIQINQFPGTSSTKTVTFKPYSGVNVNIVSTTNFTGGVFKLNGADNIIFDGSNATNGTTRNLTVYNKDPQLTGGNANRAVIWVASNGSSDPATNITIKHLKAYMLNKNDTYNFCAGIFVGSNSAVGEDNVAEAANSNITISNIDTYNVKQGIFINGGNTATTNVTISGNDIGENGNTETILQGIKIKNVNTFTANSNYIHNIYRDNSGGSLKSSGIYVSDNSTNGTIERNTIVDGVKTINEGNLYGGILLASTSNSSNILVKNNFVRDILGYNAGNTYAAGGYGIRVNTGGGYKIYNNTVLQKKSQSGNANGYCAALFVEYANNLDVRNNIFVNAQPASDLTQSFGELIKLDNTSGFTKLENNNVFGEYIGYLGTNPDGNPINQYQTSIDGWRSTTGKEVGSINMSPVFKSTTDLHIDENNAANNPLNNTAQVLSSVTKDIDGQVRSTTTPDMGADEFGAISFPTAGSTAGIYCGSATTWNGTSWNNGTPDGTQDVIFAAGNFTQNGGTFYACSMYVLNGASVNFGGNIDVIVTHSVNIQSTGSLTFESGANLIQIEDVTNTGTATIKRDGGRLKRLDYTLWCAPVLDSRTTGYQTLRNFSPMTSNGRFYDYHTLDNNYWPLAESTAKFELGRGVLIRMPNSDATTGYNAGTARIIFHGSFTGTPNSGTIRKAMEYNGASQAYNVVGNPYPSPISATDFINANVNTITGTIWLWRKTNDSSQSSYGTLNLAGYAANSAPGGTSADGNDLIANPYTVNTKGFLNTGQGFFVKATGAKELVYTNNMRLQTHSTSFFKSAAAATQPEEEDAVPAQFDRVWLNATNESGLFAQALVGYSNASTTGYDMGYDGDMITQGTLNLYSILQTEADTLNLAIQTRGSFAIADQVKMGFAASAAGTYTINIDHMDGVFASGQKVYIKDNAAGITRELTAYNYTFTTEAGQFNDRFTVFYTTAAPQDALDTEPVVSITKETMVYSAEGKVKAVAPENIKSVVVYDITGKVLYQNAAVNDLEFASSDLNASHQVVIVNVTLDNQKVISKKLMMN